MKGEAINTFNEGLIMDLHPLTTPNNVLTNCLNGTVITYNGNEFVLQNDIGNGEVHTAYLNKGYVPVGIKEHGGIIYVAAHNPITGKSQIGSFPSPQQLYEGEDLNVTPVQINFSDFIYIDNSNPHIKLEYFKQKLFQEINSDDAKVFHPGDRFILVSDNISSQIKQAISDGVLKLRLGVINSSGNIDYINNDNLKIYDNGLWIYETSSQDLLDILKNPKLVQVFSAKSSGNLILVVELKTFSTFNLIRKYSSVDDERIKVSFIGETTSAIEEGIDLSGLSTENPNVEIEYSGKPLSSGTYVTQSPSPQVDITGTDEIINYKIKPVCPYGVLDRMVKNGTINFSDIKNNKEVLNEWRFYITDTYVKIGWGYDYYNLDESINIEKIVINFIDINHSDSASSITQIGNQVSDNIPVSYAHVITKDYYNGSFEEIIPFTRINKNWVYLIRIDRYINGTPYVVDYRLLYTGAYFNDFYAAIPDFNNPYSESDMVVPFKVDENRTPINLSIINTSESKVTLTDTVDKLYKKTSNSSGYPSDGIIVNYGDDYIDDTVTDTTNISEYRWKTLKEGTYTVNIKSEVEYGNWDEKLYAGSPDEKILKDYFDIPNKQNITFDNTNQKFSSTSILTEDINVPNYGVNDIQVSKQEKDFVISNIKTSRGIISTSNPVINKVVVGQSLTPLYKSDMNSSDKNQLYGFTTNDSYLVCVSSNEDNSRYGTSSANGTTNKVEGTVAGDGTSEGVSSAQGLQSDSGSIGILTGHGDDKASLAIKDVSYRNPSWNKWYHDDEIDARDNFMFPLWKADTGLFVPVNLASHCDEAIRKDNLVRIDKMLNCILSQIFTVNTVQYSNYITYPNPNNYVYHLEFPTICNIELSSKYTSPEKVDTYQANNPVSIEEHIAKWQSSIPSLHNFLPKFVINNFENIKTQIEIGEDLVIGQELLNYYTNAESYYVNVEYSEYKDKTGIYTPSSWSSRNKQEDGSYTYTGISNFTKNPSYVYDWNGSIMYFYRNLESIFSTAYSIYKDDRYNTLILKYSSLQFATTKWTKGKEGDGPKIAKNVFKTNAPFY